MKIKSFFQTLVHGGIICSLMGCFYGGRVIDLQTIAPLTITEKKGNDNERSLILSGLIFDSAMCVDEVKELHTNNELNLQVVVKLGGRTKTGRLNYQLDVPADITVVTFGENKEVIWSRKEGIPTSPYIK